MIAEKSATLLNTSMIKDNRNTEAGRATIMAFIRTISIADQLAAEIRDGAVVSTMQESMAEMNKLIGFGFRGCAILTRN